MASVCSHTIETRGQASVAWQKGPRHQFYEDRYRLLCKPVPLVAKTRRGEIYAVCDGVGSAPQGMNAAQEVCNSLEAFFSSGVEPDAFVIEQLLQQANAKIHSWGMIEDSDRPLGACAGSIIWVSPSGLAHVYHAGDTSALMIRDGMMKLLTTVQHSEDGHLNNYFGLDELRLEVSSHQLEEGDRLILMTDGITGALRNQKIAELVESQPTQETSLNALFLAARKAGSGDDATAIIVDIEEILVA